MSQSSWLVGGVLPGIERQPCKKLEPSAEGRSPIAFLVQHWRQGRLGAVVTGMRHGLFCLGCCWMLMALLFVGGLMNLLWVAAIALLVLIEKTAPWGGRCRPRHMGRRRAGAGDVIRHRGGCGGHGMAHQRDRARAPASASICPTASNSALPRSAAVRPGRPRRLRWMVSKIATANSPISILAITASSINGRGR
jgi:hypothetical protein